MSAIMSPLPVSFVSITCINVLLCTDIPYIHHTIERESGITKKTALQAVFSMFLSLSDFNKRILLPVHLVFCDAVEPAIPFKIRFSTVIFIGISGYLEDINRRSAVRFVHRERIGGCFLIRYDPFVRTLIRIRRISRILQIYAGRCIAAVLCASVRIVDPP